MDVAVVIPLFNGAKWIRQTLDSVFSQEHYPMEVVVVDDGSEDESPDIVKTYSDAILLQHPGKGENFARNFGLKHTTAPLVTFLDHDDVWHPAHLRLLCSILEQHPECPAAVANVRVFKIDNSLVLQPPKSDVVAFDPWINFPKNQVYTPSSVVIRRASLDAIGGWPNRFAAYTDVYTWLRLSANQPLLMNRSISMGYRWHQNAMNINLRLKKEEIQRYFDAAMAASEDAVAHRLTVYPQDSARLKKNLEMLRPMSNILKAVANSECKLLKESALTLEESLAGESTAFIQSILHMLAWFLVPHLSMELLENRTEVVEILIEHWPKEARNTRQAIISSAFALNLLAYLYKRPLKIKYWKLFVDLIFVKLQYSLEQLNFFRQKNL
ncbi:glycosyltransferase family A protein [Nostoc sp. DSM 114161]|jgi:glycosyltransferase involved in cell wall biosynthesis|uniref:glycosyltransferase family 2 protein n=1 Tax=Nostoc sp. DSM 114161 TaxID=3440143 RepID=UPI00404586CD